MNALTLGRSKQVLGNVALATEQFAEHLFGEIGHRLDVVVGYITGSDEERDDLSSFIDGEMQLETVEPTHGAIAPGCQPSKHLVSPYPPVVTDDQFGGVDVIGSGRCAQ